MRKLRGKGTKLNRGNLLQLNQLRLSTRDALNAVAGKGGCHNAIGCPEK